MDISAVSTLANSNNTSAVADKLKNNVKRAWWKKFIQENPYQHT